MSVGASSNWHAANQNYLMAALALVRNALRRSIAEASAAAAPDHTMSPALGDLAAAMATPPALETLCAAFGLSPFERDMLLLCAGVEFDGSFAALCAEAQGDPQRAYPTFSLALAALPNAHWSALAPDAPLRRWRLIEIGAGNTLTSSPLRIDERVLHTLAGVAHFDQRLAGVVVRVQAGRDLTPSHQALSSQIAAAWSRAVGEQGLPVIQLCGDEPASRRAIAAAASAELGLDLYALAAATLPNAPSEIEAFARLWEREAILGGGALLLECDDLEPAPGRAAARLIARLPGPLIIAGRERRTIERLATTFDVRRASASEQRAAWHAALGPAGEQLNGQIDTLVSQFSLATQDIFAVGGAALEWAADTPADELGRALWDACRGQARPRLDDLAQPIEPAAAWDDLVLPEAQRLILRDIAAHVRQRAKVYEQWGFAEKGARGLGISALFAGSSGTGKTMAAEVLAHELRLDLYRIDLSAVVSKYIGETEKNLRQLFDAAEAGGAILLFDEADALFGKRSEVKDSHDRYANIEVSYLLQRMEQYRGLAILTTNLKNALDTAFLRRIRFVVQFPFPDAAQRAEIWRRIFPRATPTEGLAVEQLARLNVAGGNIRNIALNAAFQAADAGEPVRMRHLLRAARGEYAKLEKTLTEAEVSGWA